jgi:lipopolysaccharide/colanic/teichoic acid biosynthesis glycosyltransferase
VSEAVAVASALEAPAGPAGFDLPERGLFWRRRGKRAFDIVASLAITPFVLPAVAAASAIVLVTMGRPVFFRQARVGLGGREFMILKLRTMRPSEQEIEIATAIGDRRITPAGRWLRRFHIDELPQLWNVLAGEMSLVGPRPEQPGLAEAYAREAPEFAYRVLMRPGITGLAQVRAGYAADLAETRVKLAYDLLYLKNCTFLLDAEICARTVWAFLSGADAR